MRKNKMVAGISMLFLLTGCGLLNGGNSGGYTYSQRYKYDDEFHWQEAIGHPEEIRNYGEHEFGEQKLDVVGVPYRICSICRYKEYLDNESGGFSNVTEFASDVEIHTDYQKRYLSYADSTYDKMPQNSYPDGSKNISDPVFTKIMWKYDQHKSDITYSLSISQNEDMEDSIVIMGDNKQEIDAYNFFLGTNYYRVNAIDPYGETHSSRVYKLNVDKTFPRNLYVGGRMTNCRDTGGRVISTGGVIRQGLLYRTCGNGYNQDGKKIDDEGKYIMLNQLKVKTELNLHNNSSYDFKFDGTSVYATLMDYADGSPSKHHFSRNTESVKNVFELLAKKELYPIYYHCRIGTDRTGLIAILLNGVLGVKLNDIYQDYLFSNFGKIGSKRKIGTNEADDISNYINEIKKLPGASFNEQCYNALLTIGVPKETINKVLDIFIEGEKPVYSDNQIVVAAKDMELRNCTLSTSNKTNFTERDYPSSYVTLVNGASATATFTLEEMGTRTAYMYVGNNDASSTKMMESSVIATIDGQSIAIPSISFKEAGMGYCSGNRTNYYFVKLGDLGAMTAGQHIISVTGAANNLILGNIAIL
ncbi:MAG: tyrosine-protein phosphatase [Bacilli bacterium]|nr:tyrosine-protein phosphatase [Bacilli bacterium]